MKSAIAEAVSLRFPPLAAYYAQSPPADSREAGGMCVMLPIARAAKGETVYFSATSCTCPGASWGFGWAGFNPDLFPGGKECFERFLSTGNEHWEHGQHAIEQMKAHGVPKLFVQEFAEGEGFLKTPELAAEFVDSMPNVEAEGQYMVIQPLEKLLPGAKAKLVTFLVDADQLSALTVLANYARHGNDNVRIPFGAGCMTFALYPFHESEQPAPRAIVGLTDISARFYMRKALGKEFMSFTVPWTLFEEMEANVSESFLTRFAWKSIIEE
ncbi:MAG: DUF169 domain-containing protein [Planctomycetaceae bacterium]|nr:DUF169 domain-containing protein [Planctomycetaceae bacterium]